MLLRAKQSVRCLQRLYVRCVDDLRRLHASTMRVELRRRSILLALCGRALVFGAYNRGTRVVADGRLSSGHEQSVVAKEQVIDDG